MWIEDDVTAGIGLCTLAKAVRCTFTSSTSAETIIRRCRIPANRCDSRRRCSRCATARSRRATAALGLVIDRQIGVGAVRAAGARIEAFTWIQPAGACARVRVAGGEDDKAAGRMGIAIVPAGGFALAGDGEIGAWCWIAAETGDERSCAAGCCGGGSWGWGCGCLGEDWENAQ